MKKKQETLEKNKNKELEQTNSQVEKDHQEDQLESQSELEVNEEVETIAPEDDANKLVELEKRIAQADDKYLRLYAEFDNFRRRSRQDLENDRKYRVQDLVTNLLPALDNFERAMKTEITNDESRALIQGMEMVYNQIISALATEGVIAIEAAGKPFDPNFHQAVMQVKEADVESNVVLDELQKGYLLKDRVIRASMVKVSE